MTEPCTGGHKGPWSGGGKRGQLNLLRKGIHPRSAAMLPPPVSEAIMSLDEARTASQARKSEATGNVAKYSAKDKATARHHVAAPKAAMTAEKMQWIDNKRTEAKARRQRGRFNRSKRVALTRRRWSSPRRKRKPVSWPGFARTSRGRRGRMRRSAQTQIWHR